MGSVLSYCSSPSLPPLPSPSLLPLPSPSPRPEIKYDVFLSFRGGDTRNTFTSHLYKALCDKGLDVFIDYQLRRGDEISPSLLRAIEESSVCIVIFSASYGDSRWCLEELVKIMECKKNHGQIVIPIFYDIDPSDVENQRGSFEIAFAEHEECFQEDLDEVQKLRCALTDAANLSGFDSRVVKPESVLVEKIVEDVLQRLNNKPSSDNNKLVGIESKIRDIEVLLGMGDQMSNDVRKVGISGIGGFGKTTLAKAVFDKISGQFEGPYFSGSVREAAEKKELDRLKRELYSVILRERIEYISTFTKKRLSHKKILIVFDDVTSFEQIEVLIGDLDCFRLGSRVIIISRDRQVLQNCGVDDVYVVEELCFDDALQLFCQNAFKQNRPKVEYKELTKCVVQKVGGVPLALKVLGSFLLGKRKEVWVSSLEKLVKILRKDIYEVLKISYDGLDDDQQRIFLDIACFYKDWEVNRVIKIMNASDYFTNSGISALVDRSLIIISGDTIMMHDLVQAMGKEIVRRESIDPSKRSRLWDHKEIYDVLTKATGTETIEGISLDMSTTTDILLHPHAFEKMQKLRLLRFYTPKYREHEYANKVHLMQGLEFIFTELREFHWNGCPLKSLQPNLHLENLVILEMPGSNVKELWDGVQQLGNLERIDLSGSQNLIRFPDLWAPNLLSLDLTGCTSLVEMPLSFQHLGLYYLALFRCKNLKNIPELPESLEHLYVETCSELQRLPKLPKNLEYLNVGECSSLIEIPPIQHLTRLVYWNVSDCTSLTSIPDCTTLIALDTIHVSNSSKLKRLPELLNNFIALYIDDCTSLSEFPSSFQHLSALQFLTFRRCESLASIPDLRGLKSLQELVIEDCSKLAMLPELPDSIRRLYLTDIPIEELPASFEDLYKLRVLSLSNCSRLKSLPSSFHKWKRLKELSLCDCPMICKLPDDIGTLQTLVEIHVKGTPIREVPLSICSKSLKFSSIVQCDDGEESNIECGKVDKCGFDLIFDEYLEIPDESEEDDELYLEESDEDGEPHTQEIETH